MKKHCCPFCNSNDIVYVDTVYQFYCVCGSCGKTPDSERHRYSSKFKATIMWNKTCKQFMKKVINY